MFVEKVETKDTTAEPREVRLKVVYPKGHDDTDQPHDRPGGDPAMGSADPEAGRWKSGRGGRGSSKSHSFAQLAVLRMAGLLGAYGYPDGPVRIASGRQFQNSIEESVKKVVERYIGVRPGRTSSMCRSTPSTTRRVAHDLPRLRAQRIVWMSMEDFDVLWIEQAETLEDQMGVIAPTMRKPGSRAVVTWNTAGRDQYCYQRFKLNPEPDDVSILVNWQDNPWWYPWCESCGVRYDFDRRETECECGNASNRGCGSSSSYGEVPGAGAGGLPEQVDGRAGRHRRGVEGAAVSDGGGVPAGFQEGAGAGAGRPRDDRRPGLGRGRGRQVRAGHRHRPAIQYIDVWPGVTGDLHQAAVRAHEACVQHGVARLYYDASSPIRSEFIRLGASYQVRRATSAGWWAART